MPSPPAPAGHPPRCSAGRALGRRGLRPPEPRTRRALRGSSSLASSLSLPPLRRTVWCQFAWCHHGSASPPSHAAQSCVPSRSEEHTSELQSRENLVCRLLLEKKKKTANNNNIKKKKINTNKKHTL